ncbi:cuticle protein-like [Coccinella septempunctata]|uniref:cuticle protein-like n=1 Tax=Coccinella septempunctata TaxID=41139 RepID=UPI001D075BF7|nr:cuticle protein-like [Coccinella septempunctata]
MLVSVCGNLHLDENMDYYVVLFGTFAAISLLARGEESFSFHKFRGPVSGDIQEVITKNQNIDYVAKPDYSFSYGVQDPVSGNSQIHEQSRDGDAVHGEYRVLQSDGIVRIVRYTADAENGFQATIEYEPNDPQ